MIVCNDSSSITSADEDSDAETTDAMESSLPDPDVTLDDDLSAIDDHEPCSTRGEMIVRLHCKKVLSFSVLSYCSTQWTSYLYAWETSGIGWEAVP